MRKALAGLGQIALVGVVGWFVWQAVASEIEQVGQLTFPITISWGWLGLGALTVLVTFGVLIHAWRTVLGGWDQQLVFRRAARIWTVSNLGRYLPGKIWAVAGLAVLAQREGVAAWAAGAAALVMQFIAIGTGAVVVAATAQTAGLQVPLHTSLLWVIGFLAMAIIAFLATSDALRRVGQVVRSGADVRPLAPRAAVSAVVLMAGAWALYGVAFWFIARGVLPDVAPSIGMSIGAFTGAYIVGLLVVPVPGGVGVREGALVTLLAPSIGAGAAMAVAVASRLIMTGAELLAAAIATLGAGSGEEAKSK